MRRTLQPAVSGAEVGLDSVVFDRSIGAALVAINIMDFISYPIPTTSITNLKAVDCIPIESMVHPALFLRR